MFFEFLLMSDLVEFLIVDGTVYQDLGWGEFEPAIHGPHECYEEYLAGQRLFDDDDCPF